MVEGGIITFTREVFVHPGGDPGMNGIYGASGAARFTARRVSEPTPPAKSAGAAPVTTALRLVVLGTGNPNPDPDRSGPAVAIVAGTQAYVVDAGPGVVRRAAAAADCVPALSLFSS